MDFLLMVKALFSLGLIVALILLLAKAGQKCFRGRSNLNPHHRQTKVIERYALDTKRSLVRFQDHQHIYLVLLGQQGEHLLHKEALMPEGADDSSM